MINSLLLDSWLDRWGSAPRLLVAYSGGLDSSVLLHCLAAHEALKPKLHAIHIHHGLSPNADFWEAHCQRVCGEMGIAFSAHHVTVTATANIEETARNTRYAVFASQLEAKECLLLGHHQDDQAETVLLNLFRGCGVDGLAAMPEISAFSLGALHRPLLQYPREQLLEYARKNQLEWIEDDSNQDTRYSRNFIRHQLLPCIEQRWPSVVKNLARTARHCSEAQAQLQELTEWDVDEALLSHKMLSLEWIIPLSRNRIQLVLRRWFRANGVRSPSAIVLAHVIDQVILARLDANPQIQWDGVILKRHQQHLHLLDGLDIIPPVSQIWSNFPEPILLEGTCKTLHTQLSVEGAMIPESALVEVRFRVGGERMVWHGQTKSLKKLMQQWLIPDWQRDHIPLIYVDGYLAVVVGHAISDTYFGREKPRTFLFTEAL